MFILIHQLDHFKGFFFTFEEAIDKLHSIAKTEIIQDRLDGENCELQDYYRAYDIHEVTDVSCDLNSFKKYNKIYNVIKTKFGEIVEPRIRYDYDSENDNPDDYDSENDDSDNENDDSYNEDNRKN